MASRVFRIVILGLGVGSEFAGAQRPDVRLSASAGSATDVTGISSRAASVAAGLSYSATLPVTLGLDASGTRFDRGAWSGTAGVALSARSSPRRVVLTLDAVADYTTTSYHVWYTTLAITPGLQGSVGPLTAFAGGRASHARSSTAAGAFPTAPIGGLPQGPSGTPTISRSAATALYGALLTWDIQGGRAFGLRYVEERGTVADARQVEQTGGLTMALGGLTLAGSLGRRDVEGSRTDFGSGAASVALSPVVSIDAAGGRYAANRMTGASAGRFMSLGMSLRVGGRAPSLPRPAGAPPPGAGLTRLSISAPDAERVELAGDFTRWDPVPARRAPNGVWYLDVRLAPGEYRYAFRIDGKTWRVPGGARSADDDFGGKSAWVTVSAGARSDR